MTHSAPQPNADLTKPKSKALLSTSTNREELMAAHICVACRAFPAVSDSVHCSRCYQQLSAADYKAFNGYLAEIGRS